MPENYTTRNPPNKISLFFSCFHVSTRVSSINLLCLIGALNWNFRKKIWLWSSLSNKYSNKQNNIVYGIYGFLNILGLVGISPSCSQPISHEKPRHWEFWESRIPGTVADCWKVLAPALIVGPANFLWFQVYVLRSNGDFFITVCRGHLWLNRG